jgi:hypothetical protein
MRISISEFRDMLEQHSQELRQAQEDYNLMADEKEAEIKELQAEIQRADFKIADILEAFGEFKDHCVLVTRNILDGAPVRGAIELMEESYDKAIDGLDGY